MYLAQFLNIISLGITFLVHSYLLSEIEVFHFMFFFLIFRITDMGLVIVVFLPLYVT